MYSGVRQRVLNSALLSSKAKVVRLKNMMISPSQSSVTPEELTKHGSTKNEIIYCYQCIKKGKQEETVNGGK